jgi:drug/metabolite transporter (DMT)-like permease
MAYLILCILSSTGIFLVFKFLDQKKLPPYPVILINYLVAAIIGFVLNSGDFTLSGLLRFDWIPLSILIGFLFIVMFFLVARSSSEAGISITTVSSKMSVVFPISFSIIIEPNDTLNVIKAVAIFSALAGVLLTVYSPEKSVEGRKRIIIPLLLFVGMGVVDSLVKFAQFRCVTDQDTALFSAVLFAMALLTGIIILPFRGKGLSEFSARGIWPWGIILGIVNFGSIFLMVSALNFINESGNRIDSSIIYGANNIGIVSLSVLSGLIIFREKLSFINWIGIVVSAIAILLFSFS